MNPSLRRRRDCKVDNSVVPNGGVVGYFEVIGIISIYVQSNVFQLYYSEIPY